MEISPNQLKSLERKAKIIDGGELAIADELDAVEAKVDKADEKASTAILEAGKAVKIASETAKMKGDDGYTPKKGIDYTDGQDYVLTDSDKVDIAKKIKVPVVKKVIEIQKTETIIREQPIVKTEIVKEAISDAGDVIVNKINSLPIEPDKQIDIEHIKGWKKWLLEQIGKSKDKVIYTGSGGTGGGRAVKAYDLATQLNGVTKTFNIPAVYRIISVHASSFPYSFRENIDFTWTGTTITFTSEVTASSTLATGQTVTIVYSEA